MRSGDTFFIEGVADRHLWVIVSDPGAHPDRVVFLSLTSYDVTKEDACLIEADEHPNLTHRTCVAYFDPREAPLARLEQLRDAGRLRMKAPVTPAVLDRIRRGVSLSREIKFKFVELLIEQGIID